MTVAPAGFQALANSASTSAVGASKVGPVDKDRIISVSLRLRSRTDAPPLPIEPLTAAPIGQREHLTREVFAQQHGASSSDIDAVTKFAHDHGLTVVETSVGRRTVVLSGTTEQMTQAFAVELNYYQTPTFNYYSHEGNVHVPSTLAQVVESVQGLDDRPLVQPHFRQNVLPPGIAPQAVQPVTPSQVAKLYGFPAISAAGQTIGIIEFGGGFKLSDIQSYFNNTVHLPVPSITVVGVDGATNSPGQAADLEVVLDIDVAAAAAPGAKIVVYFAPNNGQGIMDAITTAVHDAVNRPSVLSISWGGSESGWGSSIAPISAAFQEAAAMGVTVLVSSGDSGAQTPAQVEYFAADQWVCACGGTTLNVTGATFTESTWGGSGGGVSNVFAQPYWQSWAGVPTSVNPAGHVGRGVPDIAGNADPSSGYMLILNGNSVGPIGGTSAVAPLYAGLVALLNATLGEPVGYLNYNLYAFAGPAVYRDIVAGNNGAYNAKAGWDACTGFGSVNGTGIANALWGVGLPPALEVFNNKLFMAWKGIERDDRIFYSSLTGSTWAAQQAIGNIATSSGVALATFNGKLCMAWKGMDADQGIYFSTFDGTAWAPQQLLPNVGTSTGPRLAVFGGRLYMAWKGIEGDQGIYWSNYNGSAWLPQKVIPGVASSVGPALATFNNQLVAIWKGMYGDQGIYYSTFNGSAWAAQKVIAGVGSSEGPSLAVFGGKLYAAWKGIFTDQRLFWSTFNGTTWAPQQILANVATSVGPSLCTAGNQLYAAWKGMLGDERIWYSSYNGTAWALQQVGPGWTSPDL